MIKNMRIEKKHNPKTVQETMPAGVLENAESGAAEGVGVEVSFSCVSETEGRLTQRRDCVVLERDGRERGSKITDVCVERWRTS